MTAGRPPVDPLDRDLEHFLAQTAQPIPAEVLDDVIAAIPRTRQERQGAGWRRLGRLAPVVGTAAGLAILVLALNLSVIPGPGASPSALSSPTAAHSLEPGVPRSWDPQVDFVLTADGANPGPDRYGIQGVWAYRQGISGTNPADAALLTEFDNASRKWLAPGLINLVVSHHDAGLTLHPWSDGSTTDRSAIVTWSSPVSASVVIQGSFAALQRPCGVEDTPVEVSIRRNAAVVWSATLVAGNQPFVLQVDVEPGTVLSFAVAPSGNASCDGTDLRVSIESR